MKKALFAISIFTLVMGIVLITLPLVTFPTQTVESYQIPKSQLIVGGWMPIAPVAPAMSMAKGAELNAGDSLKIQINVTAGKNINFYLNSGVTGLVYPYSGLTNQLSYQNVTTLNKDWTVPTSSQYSFVFNSTQPFSYLDANISVTKQWSETAYNDVTRNIPLLPFGSVYIGIIVSIVGLVITVPAAVKHST